MKDMQIITFRLDIFSLDVSVFPNICYSESVFWHNVYDIKNVTFGIKIGQKFYHFNFNKFTQAKVFF